MATPLIIAIPPDQESLKQEIERTLEPHAHVMEQPPVVLSPDMVTLLVDFISTTADVATIVNALLELKKRFDATGQRSGMLLGNMVSPERVPLEEADEALLRQLLEQEI
jgi:hypothetical protein